MRCLHLTLFIVLNLAFTLLAKERRMSDVLWRLRQDTCTRKPAYGLCKGASILWYYDIIQAQCLTFTYSNCGGNRNRFQRNEDCQEFCAVHKFNATEFNKKL
ncbi:hypothetical protein KR009_003304 [Drosophila setifemur]|nr:hypothetical protein KR009_003304 [Drosophila setifemur]